MTNKLSANESIAIILLAAGCSSRLGQPKQLVEYNGEPLIVRQAKLALTQAKQVICVLGYQAQHMQQALAGLPVKTVINKNWQQGMASSIACGIAQLEADVDAAMVLLVDQWQLTTQDLSNLITSFEQSEKLIALSQYQKANTKEEKAKEANTEEQKTTVKGPPVIFANQFFNELMQLKGHSGAKPLIAQYKSQALTILLPNAKADLDVMADLEKLKIAEQNLNLNSKHNLKDN